MNNKGQMIIVKIMLAILLFIAVIFIYPVTSQSIGYAGNTSENLNCSAPSNSSTSVRDATCIVMDLGLFYFISSCIAVGLAFITGRKTITGVLTAIFTTLLVIVLITPLKSLITLFRDSDHLYCGSAALSVGQNLLCIFVDMWLFYFVVASIAAAITYISLREFVPEGPQ